MNLLVYIGSDFFCLVKTMSQTINFQWFSLTVFAIVLNRGDQDAPNEIVSNNPRRKYLQRLATNAVNLFLLDSVFFFNPRDMIFL